MRIVNKYPKVAFGDGHPPVEVVEVMGPNLAAQSDCLVANQQVKKCKKQLRWAKRDLRRASGEYDRIDDRHCELLQAVVDLSVELEDGLRQAGGVGASSATLTAFRTYFTDVIEQSFFDEDPDDVKLFVETSYAEWSITAALVYGEWWGQQVSDEGTEHAA